MKFPVVPLILSALLLCLSAPTFITYGAEHGLQRLHQTPPTASRPNTQALLQHAEQRRPPHADTIALLNLPKAQPVVLYSAGAQLISIQRLHPQTGDLLGSLSGEAWVNALHRGTHYWQSNPYQRPVLIVLTLLLLPAFWARKIKVTKLAIRTLDAEILLVYASQTGTAQAMAEELQQALQQQGRATHCASLNALTPQLLQQCSQAFFMASTCGDGQAPDNGARFASRYFSQQFDFSRLNFGVLALGDSRYPQFCAFGLQLHQWLEKNQGRVLFTAQTYDSSTGKLPKLWRDYWHQQGLNSTTKDEPWGTAHLAKRVCLNPNSHSDPLYLLRFRITELAWQAGDILCCQIPTPKGHVLREYSIANTMADSPYLELIIRQLHKDNGELGVGSGWLTKQLMLGASVMVKVRPNPTFASAPAHAPVVLIGAGSGIAGLRSHWQYREAQGTKDTWLIYGERSPTQENFLPTLLHADSGHISKTFSQCGARPQYVQDFLVEHVQRLKFWLNSGAYFYVCGNQAGMGEGVHQTLLHLFGENTLKRLTHEGRYRRDLY